VVRPATLPVLFLIQDAIAIMAPLVEDSQIKAASLHTPLPVYAHVYVWPFLFVWPTFAAYYFSEERYNQYIGGQEWTFVWMTTIISLQSLSWLVTQWNVNIATLFTTITAKSVSSASLIKVIPIENAGAPEICKIERDSKRGKQDISFLFQKRRFFYSHERGSFAPMSYPVDAEPKPAMRTFQESRGLPTEAKVEEAALNYGDNTFDIPVPTFTELWKEHAVAPFFVFQIFCVGL